VVTPATLGGTMGNDIWGWTDPLDNTDYVLMGVNNGTAFVRLTDPNNPTVIGRLPTQTSSSAWRDTKVYMNHAYIVADSAGAHGMQVFDLTRLRTGGTGQTFAADVVYGDFGSAHNLAIDESSGFAYIVGSNTCGGGLHMVDIRQPLNPLFAGCHSVNGDTHDAQCVTYVGPDPDYSSAEICFNSNEDSVAIVDVSIKSSPNTLAIFTYPNLGYVHQAWLDDTQQYLVVNDEFDEERLGLQTGTIVIDVTDLDAPSYLYTHRHATNSTDHNLFVSGNRVFEANYTSGLRILEFTSLATDTFTEVGFFDTYPENNSPGTVGAWGVYPFFSSGTVVVSDIERGLFVLSPD
ncbi:MAG: choice-of-anchor B family protein, partial [Gammaproteobacteria bacterium]|nr:choice-of-anchor B family protein [Gammaproteobacteria bacterium]